jgi:hypothetical protein
LRLKIKEKIYQQDKSLFDSQLDSLLDIALFRTYENAQDIIDSPELRSIHQIEEKENDEIVLAKINHILGDIYLMIKEHKEIAVKHFGKSLSLYYKIKESRKEDNLIKEKISSIHNKLAEIMIDLKKYVEAEDHLNKSLQSLDEIPNLSPILKGPTLFLFCKLYVTTKNRMFSEGVFNKIISIYEDHYQPKYKSQLIEVYNYYLDHLKSQNRNNEAVIIENKINNL